MRKTRKVAIIFLSFTILALVYWSLKTRELTSPADFSSWKNPFFQPGNPEDLPIFELYSRFFKMTSTK